MTSSNDKRRKTNGTRTPSKKTPGRAERRRGERARGRRKGPDGALRSWLYDRAPRWREDANGPIRFFHDIGFEPTRQQRRLARDVAGFDYDQAKYGVSVASAAGVGKTRVLAALGLWWLHAWPDGLVPCTAPKERLLFDNLWGEAANLIHACPWLRKTCEWTATRINIRGGSQKRQMIARTAVRPENLSGYHSPHMLWLVDEASGMDDQMMDVILGGLTQRVNQVVMASNPTNTSGIFYRSHTSNVALWRRLHFAAAGSELVTPQSIERSLALYGGPNSALAQVRVFGNFPKQSDFALFQIQWLAHARAQRPFPADFAEPIQLGLDVAHGGPDYSALCARSGANILRLERWHGNDLDANVGNVINAIKELEGPDFEWDPEARDRSVGSLYIDAIGSWELADTFMAMQYDRDSDNWKWLQGVDIQPVNVSEAAEDPERSYRLRDELWQDTADRFYAQRIAYAPTVDDDMIDLLESELSPVQFKFMANGSRKIDGKDEMRKRVGHSPDLADAVNLAFMVDSAGVIEL